MAKFLAIEQPTGPFAVGQCDVMWRDSGCETEGAADAGAGKHKLMVRFAHQPPVPRSDLSTGCSGRDRAGNGNDRACVRASCCVRLGEDLLPGGQGGGRKASAGHMAAGQLRASPGVCGGVRKCALQAGRERHAGGHARVCAAYEQRQDPDW